MTNGQFYVLLAVGAVAAYWLASSASEAVGDAVEAVRPTNPDNIFSRAVNAVGDIFDDGADNDSFSLGSEIYDLIHSDDVGGF